MKKMYRYLSLFLSLVFLVLPVEAGEVDGYQEKTYAYGLVGNVTFLTNSPESELFPVWTPDGNNILYRFIEMDPAIWNRIK